MKLTQLSILPTHLHERTRIHSAGAANDGRFVLYWMQTAVRAEENPALEVGITMADSLDLPVLIYHAISQHYKAVGEWVILVFAVVCLVYSSNES